MDRRRLELCDAFLSIKPAKKRRHDSSWNHTIKELQRERVEIEKRHILQKIRVRERGTDDDVVNTARRVSDAVECFKQYDVSKRFDSDTQKELDEVLKTMFADSDARKAYIASLARVAYFPSACRDGCIFIAAVEGHPSGVSRVIGHCMFTGGDNDVSLSDYNGSNDGCTMKLLPMSEIVLQENDFDIGCRVWAWREIREQVFLHGIDKVHLGYSTRESMFRNVCILKDLCSRCGRKGHKAVECSEPKKAAWAGGDAL